jgi:hypothetical protein
MKFKTGSTTWLVCFAVLALASCMGNDGLDTNDGGAGAAGGGSIGGKGGAGGNMTCGPVCEIFCEFGNVTDASGCPTCSCNPAPKECSPKECPAVPAIAKLCPDGSAVGMSCKRGTDGKCGIVEGTCPTTCKPVMCKLGCEFGFKKDATGCEVCECAPGPVACKTTDCGPVPPVAPCPGGSGPSISCERNAASGKCGWKVGQCMVCPPVCAIFCEFGNKLDPNGCATCQCNPAPVACTEKECGLGIKAPTRICEDGSTAGPVCNRDAVGKCGWSITSCPASCSDSRDLKTCELNTKCQWLEPGCSGNKLSVAGCFPKSGVNCETDKDCVPGKQCVTRTVDHCAMRPNLKCITCASPINVCL